ncbi:hypothetical protein C8T65DRAFT_707069 [Cerioporus squamosus]|nr:hypothetical protein C8T65DRAFT_707069 [Cerioporus squamosus]
MYKSSNFRKSQAAPESTPDKFRAQAKQLQEAFPSWSYDDLQSLLTETNGDVQLASTRIIEGHAEQWGSVTRKKDKKPTSTPKDSSAGRGDFRGGRGGRAARGGPRGGAARGVSARGGHNEVNGHRVKPSTSGPVSKDAQAGDAASPAPVNGDVADADPEAASAWGSSTPATWGGDTAAIDSGSPHPAPAAASTSAPAPAPAHAPAPAPAPAKVVSTPATSKLSWAQIARKPQEKPTPPPAPAPQPAPVSVPTPPPAPVQQREPSPPPEVAEPPATSTGWEEPTTVQAPSWDDEPRPPQHAESPSTPAVADEPTPAEPSPKAAEETLPEHATPPGVTRQPAPEIPAALPPKPLTPSISTRPTPVSHRAPKFKTTDQPVILPASFGTGVEKVGMQFGSLSLGGEDFDATSHEPAPVESKPVQPAAAPEPAPAPAPVSQAPEPVAPITSPPSQASLASAPLFQSSASLPTQQPQPQQPPSLPPVPQQPQPALPTSLSQPALSTQTALPTSSTTASISPYSQQSQPSLASHQSQQPQSQAHHSYGQHGLPTHLDQVQSQQQQHSAPVAQQHQQQQQQPAQGQNLGGPSNYFRQAEPPYFHTPTPPAGQNQDSPYGAFGQLGQVQHQGQGSHLGNFGAQDYGYGESQRGFYDSYSGPTGFGNRNALGHDDIKGLPGSQQPHAAPGLPPANAQTSQQHPPSSQSSSQAQPSAGQGPQQSYPPPLPYYYPPYPQSQYYGSPYNSGYTVPQPFVKYPTVFQGPPGPQSAPSPATKQGPSSVQPQSPYGQGLYGQQPHSNAYDDIGYQQHHTQHSVGQNVNVSSALPSGEYGKHQQGSLYGSGGQGMQGFMGLGQNSAPTSGPPLGQRAAAGSPENAYKPYGGNVGVKDVGAGVGVGQGPQGRGGVQQPGQSSFYAQRFAASQAGGPQGQQAQQPQGQGPQGHLGYPQGGSDGSTFYSYQPRQQQGYWQ